MNSLTKWCLIFAAASSISPVSASEKSYCVYPKNLVLSGARIIGFKLKLRDATVKSISRFPKNWSVSIDNFGSEEPWNAILRATRGPRQVRSATLNPKDLRNLLFIEASTNQSLADCPVEAELDLSVSRNGDTSSQIVLSQNDLIFRPVKSR